MDKNDQHGWFTLSVLSIVICTFVRYKIPLQKAHVMCKIINVQNEAKLAHTNVRVIKSTVGYSERSSILTASEKRLHTKSLITVSRFTLHGITPLCKTSSIIYQPITRKKSIPHRACFLTIRAWIQCTSSPLNVSHMDALSYVHGSRVRSYVVQIGAKTHTDARVALSGEFMLTCNKNSTRLIYENYLCLTKFAEVIVARQAALWVHYLNVVLPLTLMRGSYIIMNIVCFMHKGCEYKQKLLHKIYVCTYTIDSKWAQCFMCWSKNCSTSVLKALYILAHNG